MFLDWIAQLKLLQHDTQTNILAILPLSTRRTLISEITAYLHPPPGQPSPDPTLFSSPAHVKWFMEVIGQGFALPLDDMHVTADGITIYMQWLFEPAHRPIAVRRENLDQEFFQIIFHQFSLLFQPRLTRLPPQPTRPGSTVSNAVAAAATLATVNNITLPTPIINPPAISNAGPTPFPTVQQVRDSIITTVHRHVDLCKKVLSVFAKAGRTLGSSFTQETWVVLLKVVLGITDYLLREPMGDHGRNGMLNMGDELCEHFLRVLFELWLRSKIMNVEMWDILKKCFVRWVHRPQVIQQWNATTLALTHRSIRSLYGPHEGLDIVNISANGFSIGLDLPHEFVYGAWHRIIYLIPNPTQLPSGNFTLAITGIGRIVDAFHSVGQTQPTNSIKPITTSDGNTLLHMFGSWLFEACSSPSRPYDLEFQDGRSEAFGILCRIFCKPQRRQPFLRTYIERFYAVLAMGLRSDACLPTILMNCTELFATDLDGVRMLVPDFVVGIKLVLPKLAPDFKCRVPLDQLRLAAIKVVSTIMCLPNHFEKVSLKRGWDREMQSVGDANVAGGDEHLTTQLIKVLYAEDKSKDMITDFKTPFTALKYYILELLLTSLRTETSSYNLRYLLHLLNVYVVEDVPFCPGLVGTVVKLIQDKIMTMQMPADVVLTAFEVLMDFVGLYDYVKRDSKNAARELVLSLCRYVDTLLGSGNLSLHYPLIVQAYDCMIRWILVGQWIVDDRDCYQAVIATLSRGITIFDRDEGSTQVDTQTEKKKRRDTTFPPTKQLFLARASKPQLNPNASDGIGLSNNNVSNRSNPTLHRREEMAVKTAAEYCMSQFVNQLGNFPPWRDCIGPSRMSTMWDDLSLAKSQWRSHKSSKNRDASDDECVDDEDGDRAQSNSKNTVRYFMLDGRVIVSVIDIVNSDQIEVGKHDNGKSVKGSRDTPRFIAIFRDTTGKYSWTTTSRYIDHYTDHQLLPYASSGALVTSTPSSPAHSETSSPQNTPPIVSDTTPFSLVSPDTPASILYNDHDVKAAAKVATVRAVNEDEIPSIDRILKEGTDSWNTWTLVQSLTEKQRESETVLLLRKDNPLGEYKALPVGFNGDVDRPQGYRLFLSQMGFLSLENRERVHPMKVTNSLISSLETLDMLAERDCITISVYYARSGDATIEELIESPPSISEDFVTFLHTLGWPVDIATHPGFKGKLDAAICKTAPYYADRVHEVIFNVPYTVHSPPADDTTWATMSVPSRIFRKISSDDHVCVVWIEDLHNYEILARRIREAAVPSARQMIYLFVNPLKNSADGLYWIRVHVPVQGITPTSIGASQRLSDNALMFGPLVDGMIVSRHSLGAMIRNTAISAHQAYKVVADTYTRPYVIRKQFIEALALRHRLRTPLSEFYSEIFTSR